MATCIPNAALHKKLRRKRPEGSRDVLGQANVIDVCSADPEGGSRFNQMGRLVPEGRMVWFWSSRRHDAPRAPPPRRAGV